MYPTTCHLDAFFLKIININFLIGRHQTNGPMNFAIPEQLSNSDELHNQNSKFLQISSKDIITATNGFSDLNMLRKGGFGIVYKVT
jgi:hypothetical protein